MSTAKQSLTRIETQALECIETFIAQNGYAPTIREMANALKYNSSSTAFSVVARLERKGYVSKESGGTRTLRVIKESDVTRIDKIVEHCGQIAGYDDDEFTPPQFLDELQGDVEDEFWDWLSMLLKASARKSLDLYLEK